MKTLFYQIVLQFNPYCLFRIAWSKDHTIQPILPFQNSLSKSFYDLSAPEYLIYSKIDIYGIISLRKFWSFLRKNLLDLIVLVFFIFLIIFDHKTHISSLTRFLIIVMKNLSNKVFQIFDLFLRSHHMIWFVLSFSNIASNFWSKSRRV